MILPAGLTPDAAAYLLEATLQIASDKGIDQSSTKAEIDAVIVENMPAIVKLASEKNQQTALKATTDSPEAKLLRLGMAASVQVQAKQAQALEDANRAINDAVTQADTELLRNE